MTSNQGPGGATAEFPWAALLAMATSGFLAIFTETIPAGLLPQLAHGLAINESAAGQLVTLYAAGSVFAAIPLVALTRRQDRKPVLVGAVIALAVCNAITTLAPWYALILAARFAAGAAAALVWGVLAGYGRQMVDPARQGRALAVTGLGQPIALAAGVPLGSWAATWADWRLIFAALTGAALLLAGWIAVIVPNRPGETATDHTPLHQVLRLPGITTVLLVAMAWITAHNLIYTYMAPVVARNGLNLAVGLALFGIASFIGITLTGAIIDRHLRATLLISLAVMATASALLTNPNLGALLTAVVVAGWGLAFGGAPTLLQTALADRAQVHTDAAQSVFVTVFNLAVAGGGLIGGLLLANTITAAIPATAAALTVIGGLTAATSRVAFPNHGRNQPHL